MPRNAMPKARAEKRIPSVPRMPCHNPQPERRRSERPRVISFECAHPSSRAHMPSPRLHIEVIPRGLISRNLGQLSHHRQQPSRALRKRRQSLRVPLTNRHRKDVLDSATLAQLIRPAEDNLVLTVVTSDEQEVDALVWVRDTALVQDVCCRRTLREVRHFDQDCLMDGDRSDAHLIAGAVDVVRAFTSGAGGGFLVLDFVEAEEEGAVALLDVAVLQPLVVVPERRSA